MEELSFIDEQEAACHLLQDVTSVFTSHNVDFFVVGGWTTYLFHRSKYGHPGTFDVDLLVESTSIDDGSFDAATAELIRKGYMRAAKNLYQIHVPLTIGEERVLFHADFLNERDPENKIDIVSGSGVVKSIYTASMRVASMFKNYRSYIGQDISLEAVRFLSPEAFMVTKAAALKIEKRQRDAFDIFVTISDAEDDVVFRNIWHERVQEDNIFEKANKDIWNSVTEGNAVDKITEILKQTASGVLPSKNEITSKLKSILLDPDAVRSSPLIEDEVADQ